MMLAGETGAEDTRVSASGRRVKARPAIDISVGKHGQALTERQIRTRKRQLSKRGRRTVAKGEEYFAYLKSPDWKAIRLRYLCSKLPKECFVCRKPWSSSFHFHHRTYKNLGCEKLSDIVPVCPDCHQKIHDHQKRIGDTLWEATSKMRRSHARRKAASEKRAATLPVTP